MAHAVKVQHVNVANLTATSSSWNPKFRIERTDTDGDSMNMSEVTLYIYLQHYFNPANITIDVDNGSQADSSTGATGTVSASVIVQEHWNTVAKPPKTYPADERIKAVIKVTFSGNGALPTQGDAFHDLTMRIRDSAYKRPVFYGTGDMESSYSYRDNIAGYTDWNRIVAEVGGLVVWGTDYPVASNQMVILSELSAKIDSNNPTVSYEGLSISAIGTKNAPSMRTVTKFIDPSIAVDSILACEIVYMANGDNYINSNKNIDLVPLNNLPDANPTWNENSAIGSAVASFNTGTDGGQYKPRQWQFTGAGLTSLVSSWLSSWATNHKGVSVKYQTETAWEGEVHLYDESLANRPISPMVLVAYVPGGGPTARRRMIST